MKVSDYTPYTKGNLDDYFYLNLNDKMLDSLEGIEVFKNLEELHCSWNNIESLEPLRYLKNLKKIICNNNKLETLSGLEYLDKLEHLDCRANNLKDIKSIKFLPITRLLLPNEFHKYIGFSAKSILESIKSPYISLSDFANSYMSENKNKKRFLW